MITTNQPILKIKTGTGLTLLLLAAFPAWSDEALTINNDHPAPPAFATGIYRPCELSLSGFGTASFGESSFDHLSGARIRHDTRLGGGVGLSYFLNRYVGIGAEAESQNTDGVFLDSASGNVILRLPLGDSGFAPSVFAGGGHQFGQTKQWFGQAGVGLEYRFNPHVGVFIDARGVVPAETKRYGVARLGMSFAF